MNGVRAVACPVDAIVTARRGALGREALDELAAHVRTCADCRVGWLVARSFEGSAGARPGDEVIVDRVVAAALARPALGRPPIGRARLAFAVAAALTVAAVAGASAGVLIERRAAMRRLEQASSRAHTSPVSRVRRDPRRGGVEATSSEPPPAAAPIPETPPRPTATPAPALVPAVTIAGDVAFDRRAGVAQTAPSVAAASVTPSRSGAVVERAGARRLFARAMAARKVGRVDDAVALLGRLERDHPDTPEAMVALFSLGELLAGRGAASAAIESFDAYLARAPSGPLVPEALAAKARVAAASGRAGEAAAIRAELRRRFPRSPYAEDVPERRSHR